MSHEVEWYRLGLRLRQVILCLNAVENGADGDRGPLHLARRFTQLLYSAFNGLPFEGTRLLTFVSLRTVAEGLVELVGQRSFSRRQAGNVGEQINQLVVAVEEGLAEHVTTEESSWFSLGFALPDGLLVERIGASPGLESDFIVEMIRRRVVNGRRMLPITTAWRFANLARVKTLLSTLGLEVRDVISQTDDDLPDLLTIEVPPGRDLEYSEPLQSYVRGWTLIERAISIRQASQAKPEYNAQNRELRFAGTLVRTFDGRAGVQTAIVAAFARCKWEAEIESPFDSQKTLTDTVRNLNKNLRPALIRFVALQSRVRWERFQQSEPAVISVGQT
jgi:hypothetical protein